MLLIQFFQGDLAGLIHDFGFVGYLVVGPEPTLSALYVRIFIASGSMSLIMGRSVQRRSLTQ
jgi:hypothetical protein